MTRNEACLKMWEIAKAEEGVHEISGPEANPRIMEYEKYTNRGYTGSDEEAWCSKFANFVVFKAGFKGTRSAAANSWQKWGVSISEPVLGCIVCFDHHVTFYKRTLDNGLVECLGGNQKDSVKVSAFHESKALDYRSPI